MRLPHPIVLLIGASIWIGLLLWQLHRERAKNAELTGAVRQYITGAAAQYQRALVAEGRLSQVMAECPPSY